MPYPKFDRNLLDVKHLSDRKNKVYIEKDQIPVTQPPINLTEKGNQLIAKTVERIKPLTGSLSVSPALARPVAIPETHGLFTSEKIKFAFFNSLSDLYENATSVLSKCIWGTVSIMRIGNKYKTASHF